MGNFRRNSSIFMEILTDPWDTFSAIWELNIENGELIKRKAFTKYLGEAYTEEVSW